MPDAFYVPDGDGFVATELTRGPWSPLHQHGGPPAALLARAIELRIAEKGDFQLARISVEILRPLTIARVVVAAELTRTGKKVLAASATMSLDGQIVARASALAVRVADVDVTSPQRETPPVPLPPPEACAAIQFAFFRGDVGYHTASETRLATGTYGSGALAVWFRTSAALVAGEPLSSSARVLIAADSTNGISAAVDPRRYTFVNADFDVHFVRPLVDDWVCVDARTDLSRRGGGVAAAAVFDRVGLVGRAVQALVVEARGAAVE